MTSIRLRLLKWLIGPILLVNLAGAALAMMLAWTPAQLAFDQGLSATAGVLVAHLRPGPGGHPALDLPPPAERVLRADEVDAIYFVVRDANGKQIGGDADFPALDTSAGAGSGASWDAVMRGEPVRVAALVARAGDQPVQVGVARTLRKRQQIRSAIVRALLPLEALFTLVLVGLIWASVTHGLQPLAQLRANLRARDAADLAPLDEHDVPVELAPMVGAFDDLLGKLRAGADARHDFLANVAHQLRTPLAGMKLQLEWLGARHAADADSVHSIQLMLLSNERMIRQTNQLLALARAEPSHFAATRLEPLDLAALVAESIQHFVDRADTKGIDLGFELAPLPIAGDRFLLRDLIDNLVDNALRYTPAQGAVTVSCLREGHYGVLRVEDSGLGIPPGERERVFERFVRLDDKTTGSGLGLAIVRDIALAHGAQVSVGAGQDGAGAMFEVRFPV